MGPDKLIAMPARLQVSWEINQDAAWARVGTGCYRHYSGASLIQKGKLWSAIDSGGDQTPRHKSAWNALEYLDDKGLERLSRWADSTREYGAVSHLSSRVPIEGPIHFVFWALHGEEFPSFVRSTLAREFFGKALYANCAAPMVSFQTRTIQQFECQKEECTYFACKRHGWIARGA
ncbi:hypothetical protein P8936_15190 [Edaphobacter paludis]|uniref:Uncharacterized protein n=1 Tax=Edaphobacter paludis TaxID=3035702 RepID=A0AAU7D7A3_9BACT